LSGHPPWTTTSPTLSSISPLWRDPERVAEVIANVSCQLEAKGYSAQEIAAAIDELLDELNGHGQPRH
jgi:hypothetical protein